jgi:hypothetical protein
LTNLPGATARSIASIVVSAKASGRAVPIASGEYIWRREVTLGRRR